MKLRKKIKKKSKTKQDYHICEIQAIELMCQQVPREEGRKKKNRNSSSQFDANYKLSYEKKMRDMKEDFQATAMLNINTKGTMQKIQPEEDNLLSCRQEQQNK